ncbi:hypothetical protein H8N03_18230 [Ramlibacter sp. USB13]|uniref:Uncharacterized protein n=1 Tax=Ramlibacter cellulosilyticus TaxID=2764187 RepID=A0A923MTH9_9BURK|nr:hypothetical protein [Ramlibacter cellulosilyticus]MBC5784890.1 hypothetical protein [Ramlibacter cellulosilyticus]
MKIRHALIPFAVLVAVSASAQTAIYRCGNTYTNDKAEAQSKGCKLVEGGNVTVVQGTRVNGASAPKAPVNVVTAPQAGQRVGDDVQKSRDAEARTILEAELKKAEARLADLRKEYNNGEPEKMGPEHKNYQKYLDRVAELKSSIDRAEQDVAGLKREISRTGSGNTTSANQANTAAK